MIPYLFSLQNSKNIDEIELDGSSLTLTKLVILAKNRKCSLKLNSKALDNLNNSLLLLEQIIEKKDQTIYGVTTGFGGSSDTITQKKRNAINFTDIKPQYDVVRGLIVLRINTILRGNSACTEQLLNILKLLLNGDVIPEVPERGSISASGDLIPLSYVGGLIIGKKGIYAHVKGQQRMEAQDALKSIGLMPYELQAKEGLALINGTGASCAVAALALNDLIILFTLSQVLTAFSVEAMAGDVGCFGEFVQRVRPNQGQSMVAQNLRNLLHGSKLVKSDTQNDFITVLRQDRYHLRTAPQWLGPQFEIISNIITNLEIEMNSTTDNPLFDLKNKVAVNGGNFQATSVAVAMEHLRLVVYYLGKISFAQHSELVNKSQNKKLQPYKSPSVDFCLKGADISMAAYMSELGYLTNTIVNHVQSAELHNQSIYSLALLSGRCTRKAIEVCQMMMAVQLYSVLQAIDLRIIQQQFIVMVQNQVGSSLQMLYEKMKIQNDISSIKHDSFVNKVVKQCISKQNMNAKERFSFIFDNNFCWDFLNLIGSNDVSVYKIWKKEMEQIVHNSYKDSRDNYIDSTETVQQYLGNTISMYSFIRDQLNVRMNRGDYLSSDLPIGDKLQQIFEAITSERILRPLLDCFSDVGQLLLQILSIFPKNIFRMSGAQAKL